MKPADSGLAAPPAACLEGGRVCAGLYRRHDLVWSDPRQVEGGLPCADPKHLVQGLPWRVAQDLPWVVARRSIDDQQSQRLRLGRCLPGAAGKAQRISGTLAEAAVWMHRPPLTCSEVLERRVHLPSPWQDALTRLDWLAAAHQASVRVYGSLAWQALAQEADRPAAAYLHPDSDLDLLIEPHAPGDPAALDGLLAALWRLRGRLVAGGGPTLDGELRLPDGGDVSWLELHAARAEPGRRVLRKDSRSVSLLRHEDLLAMPPGQGPEPASLDACAIAALRLEAETWPKPGLVSPVDAGSHQDMNIRTLQSAIRALQGWFGECARAAREQAGFAELAAIGRAAEVAMLRATGGINAYRGAIFHLGLLAAAAAVCPAGTAPQLWIARHWGADILRHRVGSATHGAVVRTREGAGGALREAAEGYPTVTHVVLPALRAARQRGFSPERARLAGLLAAMAVLEDSNLLWRGGRAGLDWARAEAAHCLERDLLAQPDWRARLAEVHRRFVARRLSPGGSADLLACACFLEALDPP